MRMDKRKLKITKLSLADVIGILVSIALVSWIVIYLFFITNGLFPTGNNLGKSDWLAFLGSYLSFVGTVSVSFIAMYQSQKIASFQRDEESSKRKREIQPIFSISIVARNTGVNGTGEAFNLYDSSTYPKHQNFTLSIENVSSYPIKNVIIFDEYRFQLLKPNEINKIQIAYSDSEDAAKWRKKLTVINEGDFGKTDGGLPEWFNINYEDIDGNDMFQTFELKRFEDKEYYSLSAIEEC